MNELFEHLEELNFIDGMALKTGMLTVVNKLLGGALCHAPPYPSWQWRCACADNALSLDELLMILDYNISLPGSTCNIVFTLSKKTLARFSSPLDALTLKTLVASPAFDPTIMPGGGVSRRLVRFEIASPVSTS